MVIYKNVEVVTTEKVYPSREISEYPIECWAIFNVSGIKVEAFMIPWGGAKRNHDKVRPGHYYIDASKSKKFPDRGDIVNVDLSLMTYYIHRINIEEKMLKQITKFPGEDKYGRPCASIPMYFIMGEVVKAEKGVYEYEGEKKPILKIEVDCGIHIDTDFGGPLVNEILVGDYVAIIGKMFGEIVRDRT